MLYLDMARLGPMSPAAQHAHQDFARFAGEVGASIQFDDFLWGGLEACSQGLADHYPGLATWHGVHALKRALLEMAALPSDAQVLLAGRSAQLMKLAAILLCRPCRNILVTDLGWPPYHRVLAHECCRTARHMTTVPLRDGVLEARLKEQQVIELICAEYVKHRCDGIFLTAVSHLGVRLPVSALVRRIQQSAEVRFVVVDGAQDFCHVCSDLRDACADLYLAGTHKWLGAYYPLGVAFYGKRRSRGVVETVLRDSLDAWHLDDPLLKLVGTAEGDCQSSDETVNLAGLFSSQGAISDALTRGAGPAEFLPERLENARRVAALGDSTGWIPRLPCSDLQSGILLLKSQSERARSLPAEKLRAEFHRNGLAVTAYEAGSVRFSMPAERLQSDELAMIRQALQDVA